MNSLKVFAAFIFGAGIGAGVTYKIVKDKCQAKANEDIEKIRELYLDKTQEVKVEIVTPNPVEEAEKAKNKPDIFGYASKLKEEGYVDYAKTIKEEPTIESDISYISDVEFGEEDEYDVIILTYYADGVLTDDTDEPIDGFMDTVGNFTTHFDGDICYVRNDRLKAYYEIDRDYSNYGD